MGGLADCTQSLQNTFLHIGIIQNIERITFLHTGIIQNYGKNNDLHDKYLSKDTIITSTYVPGRPES